MDEDGSGEVDEEEFISSFRKALTKRASPALKFTLDSTKVPKLSGGGAPKAGELRTGDRVWYRRQVAFRCYGAMACYVQAGR
eukprot:1646621-Rhodomonas_salina.1